MEKRTTLDDFLKIFVLTLQERNIPMPIRDGESLKLKPWHTILYRLKNSPNINPKPKFLDNLKFDWDGKWPKCPEAADFILSLHAFTKTDWTDPCIAQRVEIPAHLINLWRGKYKNEIEELKAVLEEAVKIAQEEFIA